MIQHLLDQMEVASRSDRRAAAEAILYVAQGCWQQPENEEENDKQAPRVVISQGEHTDRVKANVGLLYRNGVFATFVEHLNLEIE